MKLRSYLLLANAISIVFIVILLLLFFRYMLLSKEQLIWLTLATVGAGGVSGLLHFVIVRPLELSVRRVGEGARRIAAGDLQVRIAHTGLKEFKQLADQFNHMGISLEESFRQLKAAESAQRELVANMAHDLRTPLASMQSYVEAIEDGVIQDEETFRRYLATIRMETIRLGELIRDLFELSTLDAVKSVMKENKWSIAEDVLVDVLPRFTRQLELKELQLKVKLPDHPLRLMIPSNHLQRIFQNLLENAVRHSPQGGMIIIEAEEMDEESRENEESKNGNVMKNRDVTKKIVRFNVRDSGEGVPAGDELKIFERFYRSDRSRSRESGGAGLGLSIAKLLVEQHDGQIGVIASDPQGSIFWFTVWKTDGHVNTEDLG